MGRHDSELKDAVSPSHSASESGRCAAVNHAGLWIIYGTWCWRHQGLILSQADSSPVTIRWLSVTPFSTF